MNYKPAFPTILHQDAAALVRDYFLNSSLADTVLLVNSCARGHAVPESDLDFAILIKPGTTAMQIKDMEAAWQKYAAMHPVILKYKQSTPFAHLHLDIITGNYVPALIMAGEPIDYFEIEIGNQICHPAPMGDAGLYYLTLQKKWLPYYEDELRLQRLKMIKDACNYDLDHIPFFVKRGLYFQSFEILYKAFQEYLQTLFIASRVYPIAYNKWIREQVVEWLGMPDLYSKLAPILSIKNIESNDINDKAEMLRALLNDVDQL